jgi:hypothetical protein
MTDEEKRLLDRLHNRNSLRGVTDQNLLRDMRQYRQAKTEKERFDVPFWPEIEEEQQMMNLRVESMAEVEQIRKSAMEMLWRRMQL